MERSRDEVRLSEGKRVLSPPYLATPIYACGTIVNVLGFAPDARLDVELDGTIVAANFQAGAPYPVGAVVPLAAPLTVGQRLRARQKAFGITSGWSSPVLVRDHRLDFPAGLPRPEVDPPPVYECGSRTGVSNLLVGCNVWITADGVEVGRVNGAVAHQGVNVNPFYGLGQTVRAWADLCGDASPPSKAWQAERYPPPPPAPVITAPVAGSTAVVLDGIVNGARFDLTRGGVGVGTFRAWGGRFIVSGISPPFAAGESLSATQQLCPGDPTSPPATTVVQPCSALRAPGVGPIQRGDTVVTLTDFVPDARIRVYANGTKIGDGGGPVVLLSRALVAGDVVDVLQSVGSCTSNWVQELTVRCVDPPVGGSPVGLDLFPVGWLDYDAGTTSVLGLTLRVRGSVAYPAEDDGNGQPFNHRLAGLGRVPFAVLIHGNHDDNVPNFRGYDYFQEQLARMGIVAISIDENESSARSGASNIVERAQLGWASVRHFQALDGGGDPIFGGRIDFGRTGLMGHSRGGEAVVTMTKPAAPAPAGVTVVGVLALAPTDWGATNHEPVGYPFVTILPAGDGDVVSNNGALFYDKAHLDPYRCQLYVDNANHNFFNRQWLNDDARGVYPLISRTDHERILSAYGGAFFRNVLLGHDTVGYLEETVRPAGVLTAKVHISFQRTGSLIMDNHEDGNGIGLNSLGQSTSQTAGLTADECSFSQAGAPTFNNTFYGLTTGMVATTPRAGGTFRSRLAAPVDLTRREVRVRVGEVSDGGSPPAGSTGFKLGLETTTGAVFWVDSDGVGGVPRPFDRTAGTRLPRTKTMPSTLRFTASCFAAPRKVRIRAIRLRLDRGDNRALAFDDLEIVRV
ncbi:MAG TPA: hypothetical protein VF101_05650 [Gaiellaceae bacterium]